MAIILIIAKAALKLFSPTTAVYKWARDIYETRNYTLNRLLKTLHIDSEKKNFENIYFNALEKFRSQMPTDVFDLFNISAIRIAYKDEFYKGDVKNAVTHQLKYQVETIEKYMPYASSITATEAKFRSILEKEIKASLSAQEQYQEGHFSDIKEQLAGLKDIPQIVQHVKEQVDLQMLQSNQLAITPAASRYDGVVGQIIDLENRGHRKAAIDLYNSFPPNDLKQLDDQQRYDLLLHSAKAYYELGQHEQASEIFITLPQYNQKSSEPFGLAAIGYANMKETAFAITFADKALEIDPQNMHAILAKIAVLPEGHTYEQMQLLLTPRLLESPMVAVNVARIINTRFPERRSDAITMLEKFVDYYKANTLESAEIKEMLAISVSGHAISCFLHNGQQLMPQIEEYLKIAVLLYTEAWDYYKGGDLRNSKWHVPANRGISRKVLRQNLNAERDFYESIAIYPSSFAYLALIKMKNTIGQSPLAAIAEARNFVQLTADEQVEIDTIEIMGLIKEGQDVTEKLDILIANSPKENTAKWSAMKARTLMTIGHSPEALQLAIATAEQYPQEPHATYTAADIAWKCNEPTLAGHFLNNTLSNLPTDSEYNLLDVVTSLAFEMGQHETVITLLDKENYIQVQSDFTARLLQSLRAHGHIERAFQIAAPLYKPESSISVLRMVMIEYHFGIQQYPEALQYVEEGLKSTPLDGWSFAKKLAILLKQGQQGDAEALANQLPHTFDNGKTIFDVLYDLLLATKMLFIPDILKWAYQARASDIDNPLTHVQFIQLLTSMGKMGYQEPIVNQIDVNCCVTLADENSQQLTVVIEDNKRLKNSLPANSEFAQQLIGKVLGDQISYQNANYNILAIETKYNYAYINSLEIHTATNR